MNGRIGVRWVGKDLGSWDRRMMEPTQDRPLATFGISDTEISSYNTALLVTYLV
jgi:hypothetical protein